jgi:hypothetical protein
LRPSSYKHVNFPNIYYRMFLSNWLLITKIVAASVVEEIDYPSPEEFFLAFDGTNTLFSYGGSKASASNVAIYYDGYQHEMGNAYPVVLSEPGEYKARVDICGEKYLTEAVTVGSVVPENVSVQSPYFTSSTTIVSNNNWISDGWEISESAIGSSQPGWKAFDGVTTRPTTYESTWLSTAAMPAWVQIKYPYEVVINSYTIIGRDDTNSYFPTSWQLQGATEASPTTFVNLETIGTSRTATSWAALETFTFPVNTSGIKYKYFRLYVESSNQNNQVSINELKLFTNYTPPPQLTYNDYNKLTVANTGDTNLRLGANTWDIATASNVWICKPGDYKSFTVDHDGEAAYFGNVTVAAVTEEPPSYPSTIPVSFDFNRGGRTENFNGTNACDIYLYDEDTQTLFNTPMISWGTNQPNNSWQTFSQNISNETNANRIRFIVKLTTGSHVPDTGFDNIQINNGSIFDFENDNENFLTILNSSTLDVSLASTTLSPKWIRTSSSTSNGAYTLLSANGSTFIYYEGSGDFTSGIVHWLISPVINIGTSAPQPSLLSATPGTLAFHHGNFDDVYGDGDVATAAANGHVYADTPTGAYAWGTLVSKTQNATSNTVYEWTPPGTGVTADVLMVAGGGGGSTVSVGGGGGGAGGLIFSENETINTTQTIIVGNGGAVDTKGNNTSITVIPTHAEGGGKDSGSGGSGGGATFNSSAGSGTIGQGNDGGAAGPPQSDESGGGGGGAGAPGGAGATGGTEGNGGIGGNGGDGLNEVTINTRVYNFASIFGTSYGENILGEIWFAGGGGGGVIRSSAPGIGGTGGGANGGNSDYSPEDGQTHTGSGGGGGNWSVSTIVGGSGGSGIVLISNVPFGPATTPSLTYDGYNKLTVAGADDQTLYKDSNAYALGTASNVYIADPGEYTYFTRDAATAFLANVTVGSVVEKTWVGAASTEQKIIMPDPEASALLGISVAISGDYMIAGALLEDSGGTTDAGAAYIYRRTGINTWDTGTKVVSNNPEVSGWFGACVSISGDYAIVGVRQENVNGITDAGAAYIYRRTGTNTWDTGTKIVASDPEASAFFGESVSISGDYVIVGAPEKNLDGNTTNVGAAYIFRRTGINTWDSGTQVVASDTREAGDRFGTSVSISGDYAIVGARYEDPGGTTDAGAAYIYRRTGTNTWDTGTKIVASGLDASASFGQSVAISGNYAIVGALLEDIGGITYAGAAYIYRRTGTNTWDTGTRIVASDPEASALFGRGVSIYGDYAIVGAVNEDPGGITDAGAAYIYRRTGTNTWDTGTRIVASNPAGNDQFGVSVAISGDYAIVGALQEDPGGTTDAGAVYIYSTVPISFPTLTYDGITNLNITGAESSSYITYKNATSDKLLACGTDLTTYPLYTAGGNYKAEISGPTTFAFTSNVTVPEGELLPLYKYPPEGGTTSSLTHGTAADADADWTISGADYGNGEYFARANVVTVSNQSAYHAFDSNLTAGFEATSVTTGTLRLHMPSAETIHKYVVWPKAADGNRPKSWTIEGSQDGTSWTTIHTVTDSPPSLTGDAHEITSPGAYVYYRINVTANNGGTGLDIAELALYGDVAFSITFSDGWVTTTGSNTIPIGSTYTLPTYTSSLPVTVSGAGDFDVNTAGTYRVVYTSIGIDELARRVVRRFVVEYPTLAFHYGNFDATDYGGIYSTKEAAAADGFVYADTASFTNSTFGSVSVNTTNVYDFYVSALPGPTTGHTSSAEDTHITLTEITGNININTSNITSHITFNGSLNNLFDGDTSETGGVVVYNSANFDVGTKIFSLDMGSNEITTLNISSHRPGYMPGWKIELNGTVILNETTNNGTSATPSPYTKAYTLPSLSSKQTQYTWTPVTAITADVLMVAGGGGGGSNHAGGGGAGGLLFNQGVTLSGAKTIVVGNGGAGGTGYNGGVANEAERGVNGSNTHFTNLTTVIGGGGGSALGNRNGKDGGSGGGRWGGAFTRGLGVDGQGNDAGDSSSYGSGGGGVGGVGGDAVNNVRGGHGGLGGNYSSTFGTTFGDGGYFASGGGGGGYASTATGGIAPQGGGGDGASGWSAQDAKKNTGGGGGGSGYQATGTAAGRTGGSGIVLVKQTS